MKQPASPNKLLAALLVGAGLLAMAVSAASAPLSALPPERSVDGITYVSGGIGEEEAAAMKQAAAQYSLELTFLAREQGGRAAYNAGEAVMIRDASGRIVLNTQTDGPFLLINLPAGKYTIEAIDHGQAKNRTVTLKPHQHERLVFEW